MEKIAVCLLLFACIGSLAAVQPVLGQPVGEQNIIYQTSFTTDPGWQTNNPASNFWDSEKKMYHYRIEPGTGNYAYVTVDYDRGPFTLEYDWMPSRTDELATFRFGFTGKEMDRSKGPVVLSEFTNGKNGNLMYLRVITPGNKFTSVASGQGEESTPCYGGLVKGVPDCGPIVRFENNRTYHVVLTYDDSDKQVSMAVSDKSLGRQVWGYFVKINDLLSGMKRIYLGSVGDNRDITNRYAEGYIDNVKLYTNEISPAGTPEPTVASPTRVQTTVTARTTKPTVKPTLAEPTETPSSPLSLWLIIAALGLLGIASAVRKNR